MTSSSALTETPSMVEKSHLNGTSDIVTAPISSCSSYGGDDLSMAVSASPGAASFTLFPELPAELRLRILKILLPGRSLKYIELSDHLPLALDLSSQKCVINFSCRTIPPLLHVNRESRYETLKHFVVMQPQKSHHTCFYCHLTNTALISRYQFGRGGLLMLGWLNPQEQDRLRHIEHMVLEQQISEYEVLPDRIHRSIQDFRMIQWKFFTGLKILDIAYRNDSYGEITGFVESEDTAEHRQRWLQMNMIADLRAHGLRLTDIRIRFGNLVSRG